jgi:HEAT repeat protein
MKCVTRTWHVQLTLRPASAGVRIASLFRPSSRGTKESNMRFSKVLGVAVLTLLAFSANSISLGTPENVGGAQPSNETKSPSLQYDGKSFAAWQTYLLSELKAERRIEALAAMASFGGNGLGKEAASTIIQFIRKSSEELARFDEDGQKVVDKAKWALGRIGAPSAPVLVDLLKDSNDYLRDFSKNALECDAIPLPKSVLPVLVQIIEGGEPKCRDATIELLGLRLFGMLTLADQQELMTTLAGQDKAGLMATIARGEDTNRFVLALLHALKLPDTEAQTWAPVILGELGSRARTAVPALLQKLNDKNATRSKVAEALGKIGCEPERVVPALIDALGTPGLKWNNTLPEWEERGVRAAAATALGQFGIQAKAAVPKLLKAVRPGHREIGAQAIDALGKIGAERGQFVPVLIGAIKDGGTLRDEKELVETAVEALGKLGPDAKEATPILIQAFKDSTADIFQARRVKVAKTLGQIGPAAREALPILNEALQSSSPDLREAAALAIKKITGD